MVAYRTEAELEQEAQTFLAKHHGCGTVPVPIEYIVEFELGLEIRPVRGLKDRFNIEGFLSTDLTTIVVDERTMGSYPNRYRFTLAHEVGHYALHSGFIASIAAKSKSIGSWKSAVQSVSPQDYGMLEYQAYAFAGYLLVPTQPLKDATRDAQAMAQARKIDLTQMGDAAIEHVAGWMAKDFEVSSQVVVRRLKREKLP